MPSPGGYGAAKSRSVHCWGRRVSSQVFADERWRVGGGRLQAAPGDLGPERSGGPESPRYMKSLSLLFRTLSFWNSDSTACSSSKIR